MNRRTQFLSLLFVIVLLPIVTTAQDTPPPPRRTVLVEVTDIPREELGTGIFAYEDYGARRIVSSIRGRTLLLATKAETEVLRERGYNMRIVMEDTTVVNLYRRALFGESMQLPSEYHTYDEILRLIERLSESHPDLVERFVIGQTTQEKRDIWAVRLTSGVLPTSKKPAVMIDGCHHADEVLGAEISVALMRMLVSEYAKDPRVTGWMDSLQIFVVPVVNVDGHHVVTSGIDPRWRKNTRDLNGNGLLYEYPEGVDLNRNYDFNWAHGGSDDSTSVRYRGRHPFSESENRAMRDLAERERFLASITYHSQGEVIYYPWDWRGRKAPDDRLLSEFAHGMAGSIRTMEGDTTYRAEYGAGTVGQSYPWLYGRYGTFDFVVETGRGSHLFPPGEIPGIVESNLEGVRYFLDRAKGPGLSVHVTDGETGKPVQAQIWIPRIDTEDVDRRKSRADTGRFWRLLAPGSYSVHVLATGYRLQIHRVEVGEQGWSHVHVSLEPDL